MKIDCGRAVPEVLRMLEREGVDGVTLLCWKRDRSVRVLRLGPDRYRLEQRGFGNADHECAARDLRARLKKLIKREFPRSNKLHLERVPE